MNTCMNGTGFIRAFVGQRYESFDTKVKEKRGFQGKYVGQSLIWPPHSVQPLILPDNSYIFRSSGQQHVLMASIERHPCQGGGSTALALYLLGRSVLYWTFAPLGSTPDEEGGD